MTKETEYYVQMRLEKLNKEHGGTKRRVLWAKEKFAQVGMMVKVKEDDGSWSYGWKVINCWEKAKKEDVMERQRYWKDQRKASDI
jgi:hypothetical protein